MTTRGDDRCEGVRHVFAENRLGEGGSVTCRCGGVTAALRDGHVVADSVSTDALRRAGIDGSPLRGLSLEDIRDDKYADLMDPESKGYGS